MSGLEKGEDSEQPTVNGRHRVNANGVFDTGLVTALINAVLKLFGSSK